MALVRPQRSIKAILFDADGVIQRTTGPFHEKVAAMLPAGDSCVEEFVGEVDALEESALTGVGDFALDLSDLLQRRNSPMTVEDALRSLNLVKVEHGILGDISEIRRSGVLCFLASNQQRHRAKYMSETLGYRDLFDSEFYSWYVGVAKPDGAYFERILNDLGLDANRVLFLDDQQVNVESAQAVGLQASVFVIEQGADNRGAMIELLSRYGIPVRAEGTPPLS